MEQSRDYLQFRAAMQQDTSRNNHNNTSAYGYTDVSMRNSLLSRSENIADFEKSTS